MAELKKLLIVALGLTTALALTACDVDEDSADGGAGGAGGGGTADGGPGGAGGEGGAGGGGVVYNHIYIADTSDEENMAGTPGVDICGVIVECGGTALTGLSTSYEQGSGALCENIGDDVGGMCSAKRNDPDRANDDGASCEPGSAPVSDYVSLGLGGGLSIMYGQDLRGCDVTIIEHSGSNTESYEIYVCADAFENCLNDEAVHADNDGGNTSFTVPN